MCVCGNISLCIHSLFSLSLRPCLSTCLSVCVSICMYVCMCMRAWCAYVCTCVSRCMLTEGCVRVCICVFMYHPTHTHSHRSLPPHSWILSPHPSRTHPIPLVSHTYTHSIPLLLTLHSPTSPLTPPTHPSAGELINLADGGKFKRRYK